MGDSGELNKTIQGSSGGCCIYCGVPSRKIKEIWTLQCQCVGFGEVTDKKYFKPCIVLDPLETEAFRNLT